MSIVSISEWCNNNQGFLSAILSFLAIFISSIAIYISVGTAKRQNKIALFSTRCELLDNVKEYIHLLETKGFGYLGLEYVVRSISDNMINSDGSQGKLNEITQLKNRLDINLLVEQINRLFNSKISNKLKLYSETSKVITKAKKDTKKLIEYSQYEYGFGLNPVTRDDLAIYNIFSAQNKHSKIEVQEASNNFEQILNNELAEYRSKTGLKESGMPSELNFYKAIELKEKNLKEANKVKQEIINDIEKYIRID